MRCRTSRDSLKILDNEIASAYTHIHCGRSFRQSQADRPLPFFPFWLQVYVFAFMLTVSRSALPHPPRGASAVAPEATVCELCWPRAPNFLNCGLRSMMCQVQERVTM